MDSKPTNTLLHSLAYSGFWELARPLEEVIRDTHHTNEVRTSSESDESSVPKVEALERTISQPMGFHAMVLPPMTGANAKQAHGDSTKPRKSHSNHWLDVPSFEVHVSFWLR